MQLPYFFEPELAVGTEFHTLSENTSRHCVQVLRMKAGQQLLLTNGHGLRATVTITMAHKSKSQVKVDHCEMTAPNDRKTCIAIGLLKNANRMEWFLEKATELGISEIIPLLTQNTEKTHFRMDRATAILAAAMIQSQQTYLPHLHEPETFEMALQHTASYPQKLLAHCENGEKEPLSRIPMGKSTALFIGPEGDFSHEEITTAIEGGYQPVSLGTNRLRTETAGITGAVFLTLN